MAYLFVIILDMNFKALKANQLNQYVPFLKKEIEGKYLSSPILYAKDTFLFHVSGKGYHTLVVCLDGTSPRVYLSEEGLEGTSLDDKFLSVLKKECGNAYITSISQFEGDRVLKFDFLSLNSVFKEEKKSIYIELLPHHPNFILVDGDNKIIAAYRSSTLDDKRPVMKGLTYQPLEHPSFVMEPLPFSLEEYQKACKEEENVLAQKRKMERFGYAFTYFKNREKMLTRKLSYLQKDEEEAKKHLNDGEKGEAIYICYSSINNRQGSFEYEGLKVELDPSKSLSMNAETYFKRVKKAKETLHQCNKFKEETEKELADIKASLAQLEVANEAGLELLAKDFKIPMNKSKKENGKASCSLNSETIPYFIEINGTKFLFGKSAKQNAFLTFLYDTSKEHYWFHIASRSGSHVIIKKENPSEEEMRIAAEICLINSSEEDGDVLYTKRKYIRKGPALGEAILKEYKTIHLKNVSKTTKEFLSKAKHVELR